MKKIISSVCFIFTLFTISSCAIIQATRPDESSQMLESAIQNITMGLMWQVIKEQGFLAFFKNNKTLIVIDPFVNADSGEVLKASADIEKIIVQTGMSNFGRFDFIRMTYENLTKADYTMNGAIRLVHPEKTDSGEEYYNISASVINLKTGMVVGRSDMSIYDKSLDYTATSFYKDSPMYIKDAPLEGSIKTSAGSVGAEADKDYYDSLSIIAVLVEAETAYEKKDYEGALRLLKIAADRPDGQLMKTYAGLYSAYSRLKQMDMAEKIFTKLLTISVEKNHILSVKFLFDVDSVAFWRDPSLKEHYAIWIRQMGTYFNSSDYCLQVIGHCSRSGTERYNENLSSERAQKIQELLLPYFPLVKKRSEAVGKGYKENIVGSGTDDDRDSIDRRVEFKVIKCKAAGIGN